MRSASPADMTAAERLAELANILGTGVQRMLSNGIKLISDPQIAQDHLAACPPDEAACGSRVLNPKSTEPAA